MQRKHTVIIDWVDGDVEDSDEIAVFAESTDEAIRKAKTKWRTTIGVQWPHCKITGLSIIRPAAIKNIA